MKFAYREYVSLFPGTNDFRLILRPVITLRIVGPNADARWNALVDSGADETLFPLTLAEVLGIELDQQITSEAAGISGDRLKIDYGEVELRIESDQESVSWKTIVGFVDFGSTGDEVIIPGTAAAWTTSPRLSMARMQNSTSLPTQRCRHELGPDGIRSRSPIELCLH